MDKVTICPDVPEVEIRRLASNVILQALDDLKQKDYIRATDAFLFLAGPNYSYWADLAGLPLSDPVQLIASGKMRKAKTRKR